MAGQVQYFVGVLRQVGRGADGHDPIALDIKSAVLDLAPRAVHRDQHLRVFYQQRPGFSFHVDLRYSTVYRGRNTPFIRHLTRLPSVDRRLRGAQPAALCKASLSPSKKPLTIQALPYLSSQTRYDREFWRR
jgi:hypothetical protein